MKLNESNASPYITGSVVESAVGLILVSTGQKINAMTVSFFSEVAHHPTALWVGVAETALTHAMIEETGRFSLVVLNQRQGHLAMACGSVSGRDVDKCSQLDLLRSPGGFLFLNGALATTGCKTRHREKVGDHTIFVADIVESGLDSRKSHLRQLLLSDLRS